jgi:hypothetical protein
MKSKNSSYSFRYNGDQCYYLYHYLYDQVPLSQYLERKYKIFSEYFGKSYERPTLINRPLKKGHYQKTNLLPEQNEKIDIKTERLTKEAHDFADLRNGRCLSTVVKSNYLKVSWECENGHQFNASFAAVKTYDERGSFCPLCKKQ